MQNEKITLVLDFSLKDRATRKITGAGVADYIARSIGFRAGNIQKKNISKNLRRDFEPIIDSELKKMAREITTLAIGIAGSNKAPPGSLKIDGKISKAMQGKSAPMTIASVTGNWHQRGEKYIVRKFAKYRTRKWFENEGNLKRDLAKSGVYKQAYGPMSVNFRPRKTNKPNPLQIARSVGRPSNTIITGDLEFKVFSKLKPSDLPGIGEKASFSEERLSGFADNIQSKLTGNKDRYRPVLEPFLTYYINRKIPNAIFRKLEQVVESS